MGRLYNFFSGTKNKKDKGVSKRQVERDKKLGFLYFFKLIKRRLGKFSTSNLIFILCNLTLVLGIVGFSGVFDESTTAAVHPLYAQVSAISKNDGSPLISTLYSIFCASTTVSVTSLISKILRYSMLFMILTFGVSTIGLVYNMRNVCTGEHIDTWHDYFYAIKRNFKQGIVIGVLDAIIIVLLVYDLIVYSAIANQQFIYLVFYYASIAFAAVYYIMRFYIYLQLVTCEMKIGKMIKNAFLLTALGIKRNLLGLVAAIIFAILYVYIFMFLPQFAIIMFFMFAISFLTYIGVYCAYPVLKKYVIDPYYDEHPEERPDESFDDDAVFVDRE